jgi:hypothetical protein
MTPIITRIHKLLALAQSDNPNEAGIAAQAQRLMDEHRLTESDLTIEDKILKYIRLYGDPLHRRSSWKEQLCSYVGRHNGVAVAIYNGMLVV